MGHLQASGRVGAVARVDWIAVWDICKLVEEFDLLPEMIG
jgi:hypothetical protein